MHYIINMNDATEIARRKIDIDGWDAYKCESVEGGWLLTGCKPDGVYSRGKRKGEPRYSHPEPGTIKRVIVTDEELRKEAIAYEKLTGKCWNCKGSGKTFKSWSSHEGVSYQVCDKCQGCGQIKEAC